ncbi:MAG TPA: DUF2127 domain-containing protein [Stellaceae bacterium]|nr:DUF2127 domain-containing protein [Stellaceae bacterium]
MRLDEHRIHRLFQLSVLLKGAHALVECAGGVLLAVVSTQTIVGWVIWLTQDELSEDPHDFVAAHLSAMAQHFTVSSKNFYTFYLVSHGLVKVVLVVGLLMEKLWAYPASLAVLGVFILYQVYRFSYTHSPGLVALTLFDILVIALIWHEYRLVRRHLAGR